jgi:hypothetical protein
MFMVAFWGRMGVGSAPARTQSKTFRMTEIARGTGPVSVVSVWSVRAPSQHARVGEPRVALASRPMHSHIGCTPADNMRTGAGGRHRCASVAFQAWTDVLPPDWSSSSPDAAMARPLVPDWPRPVAGVTRDFPLARCPGAWAFS